MPSSHYAAICCCFLLLIFQSCADKCPELVVVEAPLTPAYVDSSINRYLTVDTIAFVSEGGEERTYIIQERLHKKIFRRDDREVSCAGDEEVTVDIDVDGEETLFHYRTDDGLNLRIRYYPDNGHVFYEYGQQHIERMDFLYRFQIEMELYHDRSPIERVGMAMWEDQSTIDLLNEKLDHPLTVGNITYNDVRYWRSDVQGPPEIYYLEGYEIVGFAPSPGEHWIRFLPDPAGY